MPKPDKRLLEVHSRLNPDNRDSLLSFAEFLLSRQPLEDPTETLDDAAELQAPLDIPRPDDESVVGAIRRLRASYPMIERSAVFHQSSSLMTRHIVEGVASETIIDELEALFASEYDKLANPEDAS